MKSFWSYAAKLLFVLVLIQFWFLYDLQEKNTALMLSNDEYLASLEFAEANISRLEAELVEAEKNSVEGIIKQGNEAVLKSWDSLLDLFERELEKARVTIPEQLDLPIPNGDVNPSEEIEQDDSPPLEPTPESEPDPKANPPVLIQRGVT